MSDLISRLSEIRSNYNCFDENEEPYYRALSEAIQLASAYNGLPMQDLISRQAAIDVCMKYNGQGWIWTQIMKDIRQLPPAQPEIIRCKDCKHNPKDTWLECPMSHLTEKQRPETAWCWKGERRSDG